MDIFSLIFPKRSSSSEKDYKDEDVASELKTFNKDDSIIANSSSFKLSSAEIQLLLDNVVYLDDLEDSSSTLGYNRSTGK